MRTGRAGKQSGSAHHGLWATVLTTAVSNGATLSSVAPLGPNPERFLDDEGTLYVTVTASGADGGAQMLVDALRVRVH
jgi:hypothetical protein